MKKLFQPFHLVTIRPWPILISFSIILIIVRTVNWFSRFKFGLFPIICIFIISINIFQWWRDVVRERLYQGFHRFKVVSGLKFRIILFIVSEIFFFLRIFWCYLHMYLSPRIDIGTIWPPKNIIIFNPYEVPLLNTIILLSSGVTVTLCHYSLLKIKKNIIIFRIILTVLLGILFSLFQLIEYKEATFTISDSVFGSIFFIGTGFHGFHVLVGTLFLLNNLFRIIKNNYSRIHHFGFEAAAWYWHFVDVVWLFLFVSIYYWGS